MRRRTKRDLSIFLGIILIIGLVAFFNGQLRRMDLAEDFEKMREKLEQARVNAGVDVLHWEKIRTTKGSLRQGGKFTPELMEFNKKEVFLIGFQVPTPDQFRDVTEFLLLPIPLECYYCAMPPQRDVLLVRLRKGETVQIYNEPVLIRGTFTIQEGPGVKFFYSLEEATLESALDGGELTKKRLQLQHTMPNHERDKNLLLPGVADDERSQSE